jgi:hypothetical protein
VPSLDRALVSLFSFWRVQCPLSSPHPHFRKVPPLLLLLDLVISIPLLDKGALKRRPPIASRHRI